ncbi:MAG: HPr kinase/phosphorylase, partial [Silanimonas sp.]
MLPRRLSARELFEQHRDRLGLRWLSGQAGGDRALEAEEHRTRRPSLVGYLNVIHPNKLQILGREELQWLDSLDARQRWETLQKIVDFRPLALVITRDQGCPTDLRDIAEETGTPLWISPQAG